MKLLALDPGCTETGWVLVEAEGDRITKIMLHGKTENEELLDKFSILLDRTDALDDCTVAIEMVASYGMPVGSEVFDTCVWIGRFFQFFIRIQKDPLFIYRKEEKLHLCGSMKANDANIRQALVDKYAPGYPNHGKGTKKEPSMLYGLKKDEWAALAVADTALSKMEDEHGTF